MAAQKRKGISKKTRFEVFKRDSFTCQYCGKSAPEVILNVDHIDPVANGGACDILNLITSCFDCNNGKRDTKLDDNAVLARQIQQLADLSEKREQLKMLLSWRKGLKEVDTLALDAVIDHFGVTFHPWAITNDGAKAIIKKHIKTFGIKAVLEAIDISKDAYATEINQETVNKAFSKIGGICNNRSKPDESQLQYCKGIVRKRMYCHEGICISLLRKARATGIDDETLKDLCREARNWRDWQETIELMIEDAQ